MFILDKGIKSGRLMIATGDNSTVDYMVPVLEKSNANPFNTGGSFVLGWKYDAGANDLTWNRMPDGSLVENDNCGLRMSFEKLFVGAYYEDINYMSQSSSGLEVGYGGDLNVSLPDMYTPNVTIDNGQYDVGLLRIGNSDAEFATSDHYKYINSSGLENWDFTNRTGYSKLSRTGYYIYYSCINTDGSWDSRLSYDSYTTDSATFRLIAIPTSAAPTITPIETDLGVITEPGSVTFQLSGSPTVTVSIDGGQEQPLSPGVGNVVFDLNNYWSSIGYGSHECIIRTSQNGYECGAKVTFSKSSSVVQVTTNTQNSANRPIMCRLVDSVVVPDGAVISRAVTCNANDESPVWEPYTGHPHVFSNTTKTATNWGLAARVGIDNSSGTSNAEIQKAIALGVLYEYEE